MKGSWEERFERQYGFWRGLADEAVARYLDCGQLNKEHGTRILVSESTVDLLPDRMGLEPLGEVLIRGKARSVRAYRVEGGPASASHRRKGPIDSS